MNIDVDAIRDRVTSRPYGWSQPTGAPAPVREAVAAYTRAVNALDDALVAYEIEIADRQTVLKQHKEAVTVALREGKKPPTAKVPSLEEIEVRNGALIAAREHFVYEAAAAAERAAREHYAQWRADVVSQLQAAAAAVAQVTVATAGAVDDWGATAQVLARLDRNWAPRTARLDGATVVHEVERWVQVSSREATQMARNAAMSADNLRHLTEDPVIVEFDPSAGQAQFTAAYLAQQHPATRAELERQAAAG